MNNHILNTEIQGFINKNLDSDSNKIILKGTPFEKVSTTEIIAQIEAKRKCKIKLPTWFQTKKIYYPKKLSIEQTSSEVTAKYKSDIASGNSIIDLTGGFGVDCYYFAKRFKSVIHCEINPELSAIATHNYEQLKILNIETIQGDGIAYLKSTKKKFDWIYIDPSRRHDTKGKVFFLKDCEPNVPENLNILFEYSRHIMIKTSPLLDISAGIHELKHVKTIHVVAVKNEVKELIWILEKDYNDPITIIAVNLNNDDSETFRFTVENKNIKSGEYSEPLDYLYEPNTAILKSGGFYEITKQFPVFKLHQHSHLYTNITLIPFPGRRFKIENILPYNKKAFKKLSITKANITTRNFPISVSEIRKKLKIKDGGHLYLFFTTASKGGKIVIVTTKVV